MIQVLLTHLVDGNLSVWLQFMLKMKITRETTCSGVVLLFSSDRSDATAARSPVEEPPGHLT